MFFSITLAIIPFSYIERTVDVFQGMDELVQKVETILEVLAELILGNENDKGVDCNMGKEDEKVRLPSQSNVK